MWAGYDFCPRVAILGQDCDNVKELIPENTSILYVQTEKTLRSSEQLSNLLTNLRQTQELIIDCEVYDPEAELVTPDLPTSIATLEILVKLQFINMRFAGKASTSFSLLNKLESLRQLCLENCEVCNPSSISPEFSSLAVLNLSLKCTETRLRLYEADFVQFCEKIRNSPMLEQIQISLEFRITPLAGKILGESMAALEQL